MTPPPSNSSSAGGAEEERCIVNDQMGAFIVLYILIFIISLPGNLLSLWAFIHSHRAKQSISVYLVNLLVSDLLLTLALPFKILKDLGVAPWGLMVFHCQASAVTVYISLYASILFLAFITTDRYLQESQSLQSLRLQEVGFARLLSLIIWLLLLLIMLPNMALPIQQVQPQRFLSCSALKAGVSLHWHALTVFLCMALFLNASAAVLLSCGLALKRLLGSRDDPRRRAGARRAAASVAALAAAYVVAFVPYHAVRTPYTLAQAKVITDCRTKRRLFLAKEWTLLLAVLHLCFDPLLCCRLLPPLRQTVSEALRCRTNRTVSDPEEQAAEETLQPATAAQQEAVL
ncbi:G-protein coupled receptor 171 [Centroberyx affinis]|uniref:G-protein coupled receptor 171 n=1 Tax=Centroberyx affinis TaxID=166261 RepID=UPI003A5BE334